MEDRVLHIFTDRMTEILIEQRFCFYLVGMLPRASRRLAENDIIAAHWAGLTPMTSYSSLLNDLMMLFDQSVLPIVGGRVLLDEQTVAIESNVVGSLEEIAAFTFHDIGKTQYVVAYGVGGTRTFTAGEIGLLHHRSVRAVELFCGKPPRRHSASLSTREVECLSWSAAGKSSEEIAIILHLSPHTINAYLQSSVRKLDSSNRTQAVAKACRMGLI